MSELEIKGNINEIRGKLKQNYGELTNDDLKYTEGKEDEFIGNLQKKLGKTKKEISSEISDLINSLSD